MHLLTRSCSSTLLGLSSACRCVQGGVWEGGGPRVHTVLPLLFHASSSYLECAANARIFPRLLSAGVIPRDRHRPMSADSTSTLSLALAPALLPPPPPPLPRLLPHQLTGTVARAAWCRLHCSTLDLSTYAQRAGQRPPLSRSCCTIGRWRKSFIDSAVHRTSTARARSTRTQSGRKTSSTRLRVRWRRCLTAGQRERAPGWVVSPERSAIRRTWLAGLACSRRRYLRLPPPHCHCFPALSDHALCFLP